jgi:hypothetical protein
VSYTAFGVPIVIAGYLAGALGEIPTITWYTALTFLLALLSLVAQIRLTHRALECADRLPASARPTARIR